jgi:hypothetical protein
MSSIISFIKGCIMFSLFLLALYVFLQAAVYLNWIAVASKLLGVVGMAFVVVVIVESLLWVGNRHPIWRNPRT